MSSHNDTREERSAATIALALIPPGNIVRELRRARGFSPSPEAAWPEAIYLGFFRIPAGALARGAVLREARKRFPEAAKILFGAIPGQIAPAGLREAGGRRFLSPGPEWDAGLVAMAAKGVAASCGLEPDPRPPFPAALGFPVPTDTDFNVSEGGVERFGFMKMEAALIRFSMGTGGMGALSWRRLAAAKRRVGPQLGPQVGPASPYRPSDGVLFSQDQAPEAR